MRPGKSISLAPAERRRLEALVARRRSQRSNAAQKRRSYLHTLETEREQGTPRLGGVPRYLKPSLLKRRRIDRKIVDYRGHRGRSTIEMTLHLAGKRVTFA